MSYAANLLATYPSSYGPSSLLSDEFITNSSFDNLYRSSVPYRSSGRLLSDDLAFNQLNYDTTTYRPPLYSTSVYPPTNYQKPSIKNQRKIIPPQDSFASLNDITEYSDSLATASNTNTASSVARSINGTYNDGPMNMFTTYPQNPNRLSNNTNESSQYKSVWNSPPVKSNKIKPKSTTIRSQPSVPIQKKTPADEFNNDLTPVQSPPQTNHPQRNPTFTETSKQTSSIDIQAWVNETKKETSPEDEKAAQEAWSVKMDQLHQAQIQREKEKAKSSRALPIPPKKLDNRSTTNKTKSITDSKSRDSTYEVPHESYFDALFEGDYFRNQLVTDYPLNSSYQQPKTKKTKLTTSSFNNSNTNLSKNPKHVPPKKAPRYEPPSTKRVPPTITTDSWRKQWPRRYQFDSTYPYYLNNEFTHRDLVHKDTDERFREALLKLRQDRAEQQNKDINEKTAKRLNYGDYVRHSTKDALLQNAVKPSPWSDFMDLKKGNLYTISKEEKKQLYKESKYYGERVRYRNFAMHHGGETSRSHRHSVPLLDDNEESQSVHTTPRQNRSKSVSRITKRPDSASTNRSHTKQTGTRGGGGNRTLPNHPSRTNRSDGEYENLSDYDANRQSKQQLKKKNVRYAKYDSAGRTTSGTEESDNEIDNHSQRNMRNKTRDVNDDLFTVREEKTMESIENARYKKR